MPTRATLARVHRFGSTLMTDNTLAALVIMGVMAVTVVGAVTLLVMAEAPHLIP